MSNTIVGLITIAIIEVAGFACIGFLAVYDHPQNIPGILMAMGVAGALIPNLIQGKKVENKVDELDKCVDRVAESAKKVAQRGEDTAKAAATTAELVASKMSETVHRAANEAADKVVKVIKNGN